MPDAHLSSGFEQLIANRRNAASAPVVRPQKIPARVYGVMALTTTLTFAALTTAHQLLFTHQLYA